MDVRFPIGVNGMARREHGDNGWSCEVYYNKDDSFTVRLGDKTFEFADSTDDYFEYHDDKGNGYWVDLFTS